MPTFKIHAVNFFSVGKSVEHNRKFHCEINKKLKELQWVRPCLKCYNAPCTDYLQSRVRFKNECNKRFIFIAF